MTDYGDYDSYVREEYFRWLCDQMNANEGYLLLAKDLHEMEFLANVPHDENRAEDGIALRFEFFELYPEFEGEALDGPCSMLEMLVALARRMNFILMDSDRPKELSARYFWVMIENAGLLPFSDEKYVALGGYYRVEEILWKINDRNYDPDGQGGYFPLRNPAEDQRTVELWYQMHAYINENYATN